MEAEAGDAEAPETFVRPIFFYGEPQRLGDEVSLHLFEPRYRLMAKNMVADHMEFVYLSVGVPYASVGDIGLIAHCKEARVLDDGRALIVATFTKQVAIVAPWVQPGSNGLAYCLCTTSKLPQYAGMARPLQIRALTRFGAMHTFCRSSRNRRYIVHTQRGFLNVHSSNEDPFDTTNIIGQLQDGDRVLVDEDNIGPAPFFWARLLEPLQGYAVSSTGNFEWLEPEEPMMQEYRITLSFHSLSAVIVGSRQQIDEAKLKIAQGVNLPIRQLRIQEVEQVPVKMSFADYTRRLQSLWPCDSEAFRREVCGLPIVEAFGLPLCQALIADVSKSTEVNARVARSLVLKWMDEFRDVKAAGPYYQRVWDRVTQAPDGDLGGHPHFAKIAIGESHLVCHRDLCFLEYGVAQRALKNATIRKYWDKLRLIYIGLQSEESYFAMLPMEVIQEIAVMVAPFAFDFTTVPASYSE